MTDGEQDGQLDSAAKTAAGLNQPRAPDWSRAVVLVGGGGIPAGFGASVVVEARSDDGSRTDVTYPTGADIYVAYPGSTLDAETLQHTPEDPVDFGIDPSKPLLTIGGNLRVGGMDGFSLTPDVVHIGPAMPAWAGANVAFLQGRAAEVESQTIEIHGLTDAQKSRLQPYVDKLSEEDGAPTVTLA